VRRPCPPDSETPVKRNPSPQVTALVVNNAGTLAQDATSRSARGVYGISVASELSGIGAQTLRLYERWGLLTPSRTPGGIRRYSDDDLDRLARITELVDQGGIASHGLVDFGSGVVHAW